MGKISGRIVCNIWDEYLVLLNLVLLKCKFYMYLSVKKLALRFIIGIALFFSTLSLLNASKFLYTRATTHSMHLKLHASTTHSTHLRTHSTIDI